MTHRYARRIDANQREIVAALKALGCSVMNLSSHGRNVPDLCVSGGPLGELAWLVEVKNPASDSGDRGLSDGQHEWMRDWPGPSTVLWGVDDAIAWATSRHRPDPPAWFLRQQARREGHQKSEARA